MVRRAGKTEMWKRWRERGDGDKGMKGKKESKKEGEGLRYKRNHSLLNFKGLLH
jgi:hypothetical protein